MVGWIQILVWTTWLATAVVCTTLVSLAPTLEHKSVVAGMSFTWATLGGIRASGASYDLLGSTDFDGNKDNCLRSSQAYSVKLSEGKSWFPDGRPQDFHFEACASNAQNSGQADLNSISSSPDMLLLEISALEATFTAIAHACIFVPDGEDWGAVYPDSKGRCQLELDKARAYIGDFNSSKLIEDVRTTIDSVFESDKVKANADFQLFVPGYLQLFYEDGGEDDWCNNTSFSLRKEDRPMLSLALRAEINGIVREVNNAIEAAVDASNHTDRAHFIDFDYQIDGQRFCQPDHTLYDQYYGDKVMFWNLAPEGVIIHSKPADTGSKTDGRYEVRDPTLEEFTYWLNSGAFTTDDREVHTNMSVVAGVGLSFAKSHSIDDNTHWLNQLGPYRNLPGLALRTFQPKASGTTAMANVLSKELRYQYAHASTPSGDQSNQHDVTDKHSLQIVMREYEGYFSWFMYQGPYGFAVNPCFDKKFTVVVDDEIDKRKGLSLAKPPFLAAGKNWKVNIYDYYNCRYESAKGAPGALKCGEPPSLWYDFKAEPRPGGIIRCHTRTGWKDGSYHRAWVVEY